MDLTTYDIDAMTDGFFEAALFTADDDLVPRPPGQFDAKPHLRKVRYDNWREVRQRVRHFALDQIGALAAYPPVDAGRDLWYSANGHGTGFFDSDHVDDETARRLQDAARGFGEAHVVHGPRSTLRIEWPGRNDQ